MTSADRTPAERASFLRDRIASMIISAFADGIDVRAVNDLASPMHQRLRELISRAEQAFESAETRGESRGRLAGAGLAKLSAQERSALGL